MNTANMSKPVGFDQKIKLAHLGFTASELRYTAKNDMYTKLDEYLISEIKGDKARKNAITMLMKIWCLVAEEHRKLQQEALELFPHVSAEDKLVLHWGMTLIAYPFFRAVADEMGYLLKLQNEAPSQQLGRKIKLLYGDRRRVEVALGAVLGSIKAWGITELKTKNVYTLPAKVTVENDTLKNWLIEVLLRVSEFKTMPINMLNNQNIMFPFQYAINISEIDAKRFKLERQGMDTYIVSLA